MSTTLAIGYDENNVDLLTEEVVISPLARAEDGYIPIEVTAPSLSFRVRYTGPNPWELTQVNVYLNESKRSP